MELTGYDYLLGYFASLLLHYRFSALPQARTTIIGQQNAGAEAALSAVLHGLRSVDSGHPWHYIELPATLTNEQALNLAERLKINATEIIILLAPTVPRALVQAATRHDIALITQARRPYLQGRTTAQREIYWPEMIVARLLPHIRYQRERDIVIAPSDKRFGVRYRVRFGAPLLSRLITQQFDAIMGRIDAGEVDIKL